MHYGINSVQFTTFMYLFVPTAIWLPNYQLSHQMRNGYRIDNSASNVYWQRKWC